MWKPPQWIFRVCRGVAAVISSGTGTIKANGQLVITMKSNSMPLNNDGDTITLLEGKTVRQVVSYRKQQAGDDKVVKAGKK